MSEEVAGPGGSAFSAGLGPTRETVVRLARAAGVNGDPAGPGDDGIDTWYGSQYLPCGALTKLVDLAMAEGREQCAKACEDSNIFEYDDPGGFFARLIRGLGA